MPTWPESLPCQPILGTLNVGIEPNVVEFKPDVGRPQRSRRYTLSRRPYEFEMAMTKHQVGILVNEFFEGDCVDGVVNFTCRDFAEPGITPVMRTFSWTEPPQAQQMTGNRFRVKLVWARED